MFLRACFSAIFFLMIVSCGSGSSGNGASTPNNIALGPLTVSIIETRMDGASIGWNELSGDGVMFSIHLDDQLVSTAGTALSYEFFGLDADTDYEGYLLAEDDSGGSLRSNFSFKTEPAGLVQTIAATFWINDSFPEAGGTRLVYGNGFVVPRDENATSYEIEVVEFVFDGFPRFAGRVATWTNETHGGQDSFVEPVWFDPEENVFRVQFLPNSSVNTLGPAFESIQANVMEATGEARVSIFRQP